MFTTFVRQVGSRAKLTFVLHTQWMFERDPLWLTTRMVETAFGTHELALPALEYRSAVHAILPVMQSLIPA